MKPKSMTRGFHHICVPAAWLKNYDYEERRERSARDPASHCGVAEGSTLEMLCIGDEGIMILRNVGMYYQSTRRNISEDLNFLLVLFDRNASGQIVSESLT
jgi:hypothetical protein